MFGDDFFWFVAFLLAAVIAVFVGLTVAAMAFESRTAWGAAGVTFLVVAGLLVGDSRGS